MYKSKYFGFGKKSIIFCSIIISLLFISSATAVPQVNGSVAIDKLDELNQNRILLNLFSKNIDLNDFDSESPKISALYIFSTIIGLEINMRKVNLTFSEKTIISKDIKLKIYNCMIQGLTS